MTLDSVLLECARRFGMNTKRDSLRNDFLRRFSGGRPVLLLKKANTAPGIMEIEFVEVVSLGAGFGSGEIHFETYGCLRTQACHNG